MAGNVMDAARAVQFARRDLWAARAEAPGATGGAVGDASEALVVAERILLGSVGWDLQAALRAEIAYIGSLSADE